MLYCCASSFGYLGSVRKQLRIYRAPVSRPRAAACAFREPAPVIAAGRRSAPGLAAEQAGMQRLRYEPAACRIHSLRVTFQTSSRHEQSCQLLVCLEYTNETMSLKAKIEAVIYASEEPVTLAQLDGLLGHEAQAELDDLDVGPADVRARAN